MEQNLILSTSSVHYHRPKGLDTKRILQAVLILAICMWLLYLMKNSHHNKTCNKCPEILNERSLTIALGRKGIVKYITGATAETLEKNALEELEKRDKRVGDDEFDVKIDEGIENLSKFEQEETRLLNGEDEAKDSAKQSFKMETGQNNGEDVHRVEVFLDENGIPPGATFFVNSTLYEPREVKLKNLETSLNESSNRIEDELKMQVDRTNT